MQSTAVVINMKETAMCNRRSILKFFEDNSMEADSIGKGQHLLIFIYNTSFFWEGAYFGAVKNPFEVARFRMETVQAP